jgi:hypothetical protein
MGTPKFRPAKAGGHIMLDGCISPVAVRRSEIYGWRRDGGVAKLIATLRGRAADRAGGALSRLAASGTPE